MRWLTAVVALALLLTITAAAHATANYYLMLGSKIISLDHLPVVDRDGETYLTLAVLDGLRLRSERLDSPPPTGSDGQDEQPAGHYSPTDNENDVPGEADVPGEDTPVEILAAPATTAELRANRTRYSLAGHTLDVSTGGAAPAAEFDGAPIPAADLLRHDGHDYLRIDHFALAGLHLAFNPQEDLYQVVGLIHRVSHTSGSGDVSLSCLTPVQMQGIQVDNNRVTMIIEGGAFGVEPPRQYPGDPLVTKLDFKSQPDLGRSFLFIHQPERSGFKVQADPDIGYARVQFGNYFQVASFQRSSSGELAVTIQIGAPCELHHEMIDNPPRLVVDFPGVVFEDATQMIPVNAGSVQQIRVGTPTPGAVRVVLDLERQVDYRLLSTDDGARHYIQLMPSLPVTATPVQRRAGRTVMIDPGHGGSDPGAEGILPGVWEAELNLSICNYLERELLNLGYNVLTTRRDDRFVSLGARSDYANTVLPYIFVSVHNNSMEDPDYHGLMTFHHPASTQGPLLARLIQDEVLAATGAVDKKVREANFFVLRETVMPSALVECGVLTNREECGKLVQPEYQQRIAAAIARGIDRYITGGH